MFAGLLELADINLAVTGYYHHAFSRSLRGGAILADLILGV